jgi:hypothetical protein
MSLSSKSRSVSRSVSRSATPGSSAGFGLTSGQKIKESDFSFEVLPLAVASKSYMRLATIYGPSGPFPPAQKLARLQFAWDAIKEAAASSNIPGCNALIKSIAKNEETKKRIIIFVSAFYVFKK